MTEEEVLIRLEEEARTRQEKKQRKPAKKSARNNRKKPTSGSVDDMFLDSIAGENEIMDESQDVTAEEKDEEELVMSEDGEDIMPNRAGSFHSESNNNCADLTLLEEGVSYVLAIWHCHQAEEDVCGDIMHV